MKMTRRQKITVQRESSGRLGELFLGRDVVSDDGGVMTVFMAISVFVDFIEVFYHNPVFFARGRGGSCHPPSNPALSHRLFTIPS